MTRTEENAYCCGAGGGVLRAFPDFARRTAEERRAKRNRRSPNALVLLPARSPASFEAVLSDIGRRCAIMTNGAYRRFDRGGKGETHDRGASLSELESGRRGKYISDKAYILAGNRSATPFRPVLQRRGDLLPGSEREFSRSSGSATGTGQIYRDRVRPDPTAYANIPSRSFCISSG